MSDAASDAVALYGTDEPVIAPIVLWAGPLTAELDAGNLRHIRIGGAEAIRAISFIVRDRFWGTYTPAISHLLVEQRQDGFSVSYDARVTDGTQTFDLRTMIEGRADSVSFTADGLAATEFETCRAGFVVLHPVSGVAGEPVEIEHVDGRVVESSFPDLIDPIQPMMDLRALTHTVAPGLKVTCRMEGDTFEMEDQRNWCDASYKTYVRPLSRPWPYRLAAGETLRQSVSLTIEGAPATDAVDGETSIHVALGPPIGPAPTLGFGLDPAEHEATRCVLPKLAELAPRVLVCHFDPRRGHDRATLQTAAALAAEIGAEPWLEAVIADVAGFEAEVTALGDLVASIGSPFRSVLLSPAPDLKSTTPGQAWPAAPPPEGFFRAARSSFPDVRLGGGMISTFTELNRKRPPLDHLDFVGFTTVALIHASDDTSVIEGLEALPSIVRSAKAIAKDLPVVIGPSAIGLRHNPYGAAPVPNPGNRRQAMALNDPRQRGQLGSAWAVGFYAHAASAGASAVVFGGTTGPFGVVHTSQDWPTPGFDSPGTPYPIFFAIAALSGHEGRMLRHLEISAPEFVQGVAFETDGGFDLVLTNLTSSTRVVRLDGAIRWQQVGGDADPVPPAGGKIAPVDQITLGPYQLAILKGVQGETVG